MPNPIPREKLLGIIQKGAENHRRSQDPFYDSYNHSWWDKKPNDGWPDWVHADMQRPAIEISPSGVVRRVN